jgi:hypothetical protein
MENNAYIGFGSGAKEPYRIKPVVVIDTFEGIRQLCGKGGSQGIQVTIISRKASLGNQLPKGIEAEVIIADRKEKLRQVVEITVVRRCADGVFAKGI